MHIRYHCREVADLHSVGTTGGVLKETVVRIEEKPRQFEEEFPLRTTVIQSTHTSQRSENNVQNGNICLQCARWQLTQDSTNLEAFLNNLTKAPPAICTCLHTYSYFPSPSFPPSLPPSPFLSVPASVQSPPPQVLGRRPHDKLIRISQ